MKQIKRNINKLKPIKHILNTNIIFLIIGLLLVIAGKLKIYSSLLLFLHPTHFDYSVKSFLLYPGNIPEIFYIITLDLLFFTFLLLFYIISKTYFIKNRKTEILFIILNFSYLLLSFVNFRWINESGDLLNYSHVILFFARFSDIWVLASDYFSIKLIIYISLFILGVFLYIYFHNHFHFEKKKMMKVIVITSILFLSLFLTKYAQKADILLLHPRLNKNTPSVHFQIVKESVDFLIHDKKPNNKILSQSLSEIDSIKSTPNIIFIGLESTRAKSIPFIAKEASAKKAKMPFLEDLSKRSIVIENMRTPFPHTTKAITAVLTGNYPIVSSYLAETELGFPLTGLPKYLKKFGYTSAFFQSPLGNFEKRPSLVENLGFDYFATAQEIDSNAEVIGYFNMDDNIITESGINWAKEQKGENKPFILFLLSSISHHPYILPEQENKLERYEKFKKNLISLNEREDWYLKTLEYNDNWIKTIFEKLQKENLLQNSIVIVFGDHGEGFGEHGVLSHSQNLYEEGLRMPIIFYSENEELIKPKTIEGMYSEIDIVPTLLSLIGVEKTPEEMAGVNILSNEKNDRKLFFTAWYNYTSIGLVDENNIKYIFDLKNNITEVFNLKTDPWEQNNIYEEVKKTTNINNLKETITNWRDDNYFHGFDKNSKPQNIYNWTCEPGGNGNCWLNQESNN